MQRDGDRFERMVEQRLQFGPWRQVYGPTRQAALRLRDETLQQTARLDRELVRLAAERQKLIERVLDLEHLVYGPSHERDPRSGGRVHVRWTRRPPVTSLRLAGPEPTRAARLPDLKPVVLDLLSAAGGPVRVSELVDLVRAHGWGVDGSLSQAISNVIRPEVRAGRVERLSRGLYRWTGETAGGGLLAGP